MKRILGVSAAFALAGCAAVPAGRPAAQAPAPVQQPPASAYGKPGSAVLGANARALTRMFGDPRLDIRERTARKLQFANGRCVLDAYLYTSAKGKEPVVTHVDTRLPDGRDTDPAGCISALQGR
jgi:hypothetical protein